MQRKALTIFLAVILLQNCTRPIERDGRSEHKPQYDKSIDDFPELSLTSPMRPVYEYYTNPVNFAGLMESAIDQFHIAATPKELGVSFDELRAFSEAKRDSLEAFALQRFARLNFLVSPNLNDCDDAEQYLNDVNSFSSELIFGLAGQSLPNDVANIFARQIPINDQMYSLKIFAGILAPALEDSNFDFAAMEKDIKNFAAALMVNNYVASADSGLDILAAQASQELADLDALLAYLQGEQTDPPAIKGWAAFYAYWLKGLVDFKDVGQPSASLALTALPPVAIMKGMTNSSPLKGAFKRNSEAFIPKGAVKKPLPPSRNMREIPRLPIATRRVAELLGDARALTPKAAPLKEPAVVRDEPQLSNIEKQSAANLRKDIDEFGVLAVDRKTILTNFDGIAHTLTRSEVDDLLKNVAQQKIEVKGNFAEELKAAFWEVQLRALLKQKTTSPRR